MPKINISMVRIKVKKVNDKAIEANLSPKNDSIKIVLIEFQQSKPERKENDKGGERVHEEQREKQQGEGMYGKSIMSVMLGILGFLFFMVITR